MKGMAQSPGGRSVGSLRGGTAARAGAVGDGWGPGEPQKHHPDGAPNAAPLTSSPGDPHPWQKEGWMYPEWGLKLSPPPRCCRAPRVSQSGRGRVCPHPSCGAA